MSTYPISYWSNLPADMADDLQVKRMYEAGMTIIPVWYDDVKDNIRVAKLAEKYGMQVSVWDFRMYGIINNDEGWKDLLKIYVNDYKALPNLHDYFLEDEPTETRFEPLRKIRDAIAELDPDHPSYVNNLSVPPLENAENYERFINEFVEKFNPEILSFDHYNLQFKVVDELSEGDIEADVSEQNIIDHDWQGKKFVKYNRNMFFDNLEIVRKKAREINIPWKIIVQVIEHWDFRNLNEGEERWGIFNSLCYGADEIDYFTYYPHEHSYNCFINADGSINPKYYVMQKINKELANVGMEIKDAQSRAVFHIGDEPGDTYVSYYPGEYSDLGRIEADRITIGFFDNDTVLFANKSTEEGQKISFEAKRTPMLLNKALGQWEELTPCGNGMYSLELATGDGELIKFESVSL